MRLVIKAKRYETANRRSEKGCYAHITQFSLVLNKFVIFIRRKSLRTLRQKMGETARESRS